MLRREVARPSTCKLGSWILLLLILGFFLGDLRALTRLACRIMSIPSSRVSQLVGWRALSCFRPHVSYLTNSPVSQTSAPEGWMIKIQAGKHILAVEAGVQYTYTPSAFVREKDERKVAEGKGG